MKKNIYYRTVFMRTNAMKELILVFFLAICSWPRLLLEVFLRKNMGERYFSFSTAIIMSGLLAIFPLIYAGIMERLTGQSYSVHLIGYYTTWYVFLALFLYTCWERWQEIQRLPSVFDFGRFSLSSGVISSRFTSLKFKGKPVDVRTIETVLEPGFFFIVGFVLWMAAQPIGLLLAVSALCYSFSYVGAYHQGDHFIMDKIDEMICNEEMVNSFVEGRDASQTRGVSFYGRRPADPDTRRKLVTTFIDDDTVEAL
ncbi:hypothetical protein [Runella sp. SP2]|uniref:hypothetical protein n=1 Tax=Runella sp. SP2 TaxID=2268026 RepID=UPI000F080418|nr:hypothetical protein [Runella sp. SP2]AYQ30967.1 hypothetical protein DTQ70_01685 [Runella sp. SP2]